MDIFKIIGVGLITSIAVLIIKQIKPEIAIVVGMAGGIIMILMLVDALTSIVSSFSSILKSSGLSGNVFSAVLKIIGVGYITEFSANLCADSGSTSIADKILLGGKIIILVISMPIISNIIEIISGLLP
jgi:stage III sporulation protein AD